MILPRGTGKSHLKGAFARLAPHMGAAAESLSPDATPVDRVRSAGTLLSAIALLSSQTWDQTANQTANQTEIIGRSLSE